MQFGDLSETILLVNSTFVFRKKLYADQRATVLTDVDSDEFGIARGRKQGFFFFFRSLLFNSALQSATEKDIETWNAKFLGIKLSDEKRDCISNLRFADDELMMANSFKHLKRMMTDFKKSTEAQWLDIHPTKTKILTNHKSNRLKEIEIDGMHVETLPPEGKVKYLTLMITYPLCLVRVRQTSTGTDIQVLLREKMILTTQRRMPRLIIRTRRKHYKKNNKYFGGKDNQR